MVSKLALVLLVGLGITTEARADRKVDWSEYLEPAGARPPKHAEVALPETATAPTTATKAPRGKAAKRAAAPAKSKAKRKATARSGRRR